LNYWNTGIVCQEDFDHKIWGALPIIGRLMNRVSCLFDKSVHLLVCSSAPKVFFTEFRQTSSNHIPFLVIVFNGWKERRIHETRKKNIQGDFCGAPCGCSDLC
jgi:hypothetical protein